MGKASSSVIRGLRLPISRLAVTALGPHWSKFNILVWSRCWDQQQSANCQLQPGNACTGQLESMGSSPTTNLMNVYCNKVAQMNTTYDAATNYGHLQCDKGYGCLFAWLLCHHIFLEAQKSLHKRHNISFHPLCHHAR